MRERDQRRLGAGDRRRRGLALTTLGLAIGLAASAAIARVFASLIHGVRPFDATVYAMVSATLTGAALLATWVPSRRATRVDPALALRGE